MQKENKVIVKLNCFPARFMAARRVGVSRFFVSDRRSSVRSKIGRCRITTFRQNTDFNVGLTPDLHAKQRGFTLIELLVVVLIIGILAAVAVPQYQLAVDKSRMTQLVTLAKAVMNAEEEYYLANGAYTNNWEELSLDFQGNVLYGYRRIMPNGIKMELRLRDTSGPDAVVITDTRLPGVTLYASFPHTIYSDWNKYWRCYPAADNTRAVKLCQFVTRKKTENSGTSYMFPGMPY